jgi:DNA-binding IclR family transcriptional regulator
MDAADLLDSDVAILDALGQGRATPAYLVEVTGLSKQTIHGRLNVLVAADHVRKVHESGLYELVDDPRSDDG